MHVESNLHNYTKNDLTAPFNEIYYERISRRIESEKNEYGSNRIESEKNEYGSNRIESEYGSNRIESEYGSNRIESEKNEYGRKQPVFSINNRIWYSIIVFTN